MRFCATARAVTSLASRKAFRCCEMAGGADIEIARYVAGRQRSGRKHFDNAHTRGVCQGGKAIHAALL